MGSFWRPFWLLRRLGRPKKRKHPANANYSNPAPPFDPQNSRKRSQQGGPKSEKKTEKRQKKSDFFTDDLRNRIFIDFWSLPDPLGKGKTMKNHCTVIENQGFALVEKMTLRDRFWYHFGALLGAFWTTFLIFLLFFRIQKTGEKFKGLPNRLWEEKR